MLVKFSCGCIGFAGVPDPKGEGREALVIKPCDLPSEMAWEPYCFYHRDLSDKSYTPLEADQVASVLSDIGALVADGYSFRQLRSILGR